jgi:hypothetical protein
MTESPTTTDPEIEVNPKAKRRQFSAAYKVHILKRTSLQRGGVMGAAGAKLADQRAPQSRQAGGALVNEAIDPAPLRECRRQHRPCSLNSKSNSLIRVDSSRPRNIGFSKGRLPTSLCILVRTLCCCSAQMRHGKIY